MGDGGGFLGKLFGRKPTTTVDDDRIAQLMRSADAAAPTDVQRMAGAMMSDLLEQVRHGEDMEEARGAEAVVVRVAPQLPIRAGEEHRSWLGGGAALPVGTAWPEHHGTRAMHLATICCADLPPDLWGGAGPRDGWLVYFMQHETYEVVLLHVAALGEYRDAPEPDEGVFGPAHGLRNSKDEPHPPVRAFPRWPVDLVTVRPGDADPRQPDEFGRGRSLHEEYRAGYDASTPAYRPFDWPSTLLLLDLLEEGVATKSTVPRGGVRACESDLPKWQEALANAEANDAGEDELRRLRNGLDTIPVRAAAYAEAAARWDEIEPEVEQIAAQLRTMASGTAPFSDELVAPLLKRLHELEWIEVVRGSDPERGAGAELISTVPVRITEHTMDASLWVHRYESIRFDWAKHAYANDPTSLPPAIRHHYEQAWRALAATEMASIGHVPFNYVHEFDERVDVTMLELPSSSLMSWMFGDVDNLVLTMTKDDLAAHAWDRLKVQWSN